MTARAITIALMVPEAVQFEVILGTREVRPCRAAETGLGDDSQSNRSDGNKVHAERACDPSSLSTDFALSTARNLPLLSGP